VPVIMNTSFNLRGEAIVAHADRRDADIFQLRHDALVIGSFLVEKMSILK